MSLKIRLSKNHAKTESYRVVVAETRSKRNGKLVDLLGYVYLKKTPPVVKIDQKRYQDWLNKGAKVSPVVQKLVE